MQEQKEEEFFEIEEIEGKINHSRVTDYDKVYQKIMGTVNKLGPKQKFTIPLSLFPTLSYPENAVRRHIKAYEDDLKKRKLEVAFKTTILKDAEKNRLGIVVYRIL